MTVNDTPVHTPVVPERQSLDLTLVRRVSQVGRWESEHWELTAVALSDNSGADDSRLDADTLVSHGVQLRLYRDQAEDYNLNLSCEAPRLFVICSQDETDGTLAPRHATASQAEAADYMETDDEVLSCPMPRELLDWVTAWTQLVPLAVEERQGKKGRRRLRGADSD